MSFNRFFVPVAATLVISALVFAQEPEDQERESDLIRGEAAELTERGRLDEARMLERRAEELEIRSRRAGLERARREDEVSLLKDRLESLVHTEERLRESGGSERDLQTVRRQAHEVEAELHELLASHEHRHELHEAHDQDMEFGEREHGERHELGQRLEHMHAAAEHLHAAGMHEMAEEVQEHAQAVQRELRGREHHESREVLHEVMEQIERLHQVVGQLREEVNELKERRR